GRMVKGSVAWQALAHSPVPLLLRHADDDAEPAAAPERRHIMVPLDGSALAEYALPLAETLAREWDAPLWLVRVVPLPPGVEVIPAGERVQRYSRYALVREAQMYLDRVKVRMSVEAHADVLVSAPVVDALIAAARTDAITDVVMVSHGYTGLSRLISGSVADAMLHDLHCPMLVIPARTITAGSRPSFAPVMRG
ncbi:MAG TPA: universal stress protein, partial [Chloroflexota bacterium]